MNYTNQEVKTIVNVLTNCQADGQFFTHPSQKGKFIWLNNPPEGRCAEIRKRPYMLDGRRWDLFTGTNNAYCMMCVDNIVFLVCLDKFGNTVPDMRFAFDVKHITRQSGSLSLEFTFPNEKYLLMRPERNPYISKDIDN